MGMGHTILPASHPKLSSEHLLTFLTEEVTDTGSTILFHPVQPFDSHWSPMTTLLYVVLIHSLPVKVETLGASADLSQSATLYFLILFAVVLEMLLLTYATWVLRKILRNDPDTQDLYGFELVFTISLTLCCIAFLYLNEKAIGSKIAAGCIFFATSQFLLLVSQSLRKWRTYTLCLMIIPLP